MQDSKNSIELKKRRLATNWLDLEISEKKSDLKLATEELRQLGVPDSFIESALGSGSLPRLDSEGDVSFALLRIFDETAEKRATGSHD
jgi:hypothetical protein